MLLKLLFGLSLVVAATAVCVDNPICDLYDNADNIKQTICNLPYLTKNCKKLCGLCTDDCGQQKIAMSRVIGGKDAVPGSWPWQIGIYKNGKFDGCGGSLVNSTWVVTAAHCFRNTKTAQGIAVALGDHDRRKEEGEQRIGVKRIIEYPQYDDDNINNDIALLELSRPAIFTDRVQPVCLPKEGEAPAVGSKCYITGWGKINHPGESHHSLQQLALTVQNQSACEAVNEKYEVPITKGMLCGANPDVSENQSGCHGDSGGPFVCQQPSGRWKLHGVVSWGSLECDSKDAYTVFARVTEYRNWIDQYIKN